MRWILIIFLLWGTSCAESPKNYAKDYKTRKIVDSLFIKERKGIDSVLSRQCSIRTEAALPGLVDSLLIIRQQEIENILRREALENANN